MVVVPDAAHSVVVVAAAAVVTGAVGEEGDFAGGGEQAGAVDAVDVEGAGAEGGCADADAEGRLPVARDPELKPEGGTDTDRHVLGGLVVVFLDLEDGPLGEESWPAPDADHFYEQDADNIVDDAGNSGSVAAHLRNIAGPDIVHKPADADLRSKSAEQRRAAVAAVFVEVARNQPLARRAGV